MEKIIGLIMLNKVSVTFGPEMKLRKKNIAYHETTPTNRSSRESDPFTISGPPSSKYDENKS